MAVPIPYVHLGMGIIAAVGSIPLIMRKVPMNPGYGIRIKKAFISQRNWYDINAYGGKLFFIFGLFLIGFSFITKEMAPSPTSIWAPVYLVIPLTAIIPAIVIINAFARRLPDINDRQK